MEKVKNFFKKIKVQSLCKAVALVVIGLMFIIFPESSVRIICYVAGAVLLVLGIIRAVLYFTSGMRVAGNSLALAAAFVCVGLLLIIKPDLVAEVLTVIFGIVIIVDGVVKLQAAIELSKLKSSGKWVVFAVAIVTLALGLVITFNPFSSRRALMLFAGISLIVDALFDLIASHREAAALERSKKDVIDID